MFSSFLLFFLLWRIFNRSKERDKSYAISPKHFHPFPPGFIFYEGLNFLFEQRRVKIFNRHDVAVLKRYRLLFAMEMPRRCRLPSEFSSLKPHLLSPLRGTLLFPSFSLYFFCLFFFLLSLYDVLANGIRSKRHGFNSALVTRRDRYAIQFPVQNFAISASTCHTVIFRNRRAVETRTMNQLQVPSIFTGDSSMYFYIDPSKGSRGV